MSNALLCIRAHFDGKVIVPDEPVSLPVNAPLDLEVRRRADAVSPEITAFVAHADNSKSAAQRHADFIEFSKRVERRASSSSIPSDALRRENMYGDDGR